MFAFQSLERTNSQAQITAYIEKFQAQTISSLGFPEIRHFLYKAKTASQFTSPALQQPYTKVQHCQRLHGLYLKLQTKLHSSSNPAKLIYHVENSENVLGWVRLNK